MAEAPGILGDLMRQVRKTLRGNPPRIAQIQLGPMADIDVKDTTAYDPRIARSARYSRAEQQARTGFFDSYGQARKQKYNDNREIEEEVPELSRALEVYKDFVFGPEPEGGYAIAFSASARPELERVIQSAEEGLNLQSVIPSIAHEAWGLSDSFSRLIFGDDPLRLVAIQPLIPEHVVPMIDPITKVVVGYEWYYDTSTTEPLTLLPFEVIHYAPDAPRGSHYGRNLWFSGRGLRRRHEAADDATSMLSLRRASGDLYFLWPFPSEGSDDLVWDWIRKVQEEVDFDDFFDSSGKIRRRAAGMLDTVPKILPYRSIRDMPDQAPVPVERRQADLTQMIDVLEHYQDRFFVSTGVPKALVGIERDVNARATLEQQGIHFSRTIRHRQREIARLIVDILTRALLTEGIVPQPGEYTVVMPEVSPFDAAMQATTQANQARAIYDLTQSGVPPRWALQYVLDLDDDEVDDIIFEKPAAKERASEVSGDNPEDPEDPPPSADEVDEMTSRAISRRNRRKRVSVDGASRVAQVASLRRHRR